MIDLTACIPQDNQWMNETADRIGWDELTGYYDRVFLMLQNMKRGERFEVVRKVHPDNYELFIKCACTAIMELSSQGIYAWSLEDNGTVIVRDEIFKFI
jgi:hypothetical protein